MTAPDDFEVEDAGRDAVALIRAYIAGDHAGIEALIANTGPNTIRVLVGMTVESLYAVAESQGFEGDAVAEVVDRHLASLQKKP